MIKVAILDDQFIVLNGVQQMLQDNKDMRLSGVYQNKEELMSSIFVNTPDVLLLDIRMPNDEGDTIALYLTKHFPSIKILALTNFDTLHYVKKMLRSGVLGYLLKNTDRDTLVNAIKTVYEGNQYLEPEIKSKLLNEFSTPKHSAESLPSLTKRETEILSLIVKQYSSQEIADHLYLSLRTVENHRYNLFQKLDVKNVAGLVTKSFQLGLV
ncbi:MAG: response regulator transcription factor [Taibaiella sp.]|jgi:DNA-binding NarL/FixJ family response regulator